jgi:Arc/MetJ family transcription regulator
MKWSMVMKNEIAMDADAVARQARFGKLPERISFDDMTSGMDVAPRGTRGTAYDPENSWKFSSCLALDLGL